MLSILLSMRNHVKLGFSLRVLYCVVDAGYGLGGSLEDCRKYQMVKTQTESHDSRPIVWTNRWQICVSISFEVCILFMGIKTLDIGSYFCLTFWRFFFCILFMGIKTLNICLDFCLNFLNVLIKVVSLDVSWVGAKLWISFKLCLKTIQAIKNISLAKKFEGNP